MFKHIEFENICGFDGVKDIIRRVLDYFSLLLIGRPSSAKTLFLLEIIEAKNAVYFDVYNQFVDMLDKQRPKIICIDELDKMSTDFQNHLLNFLENGHIKDRSFHFEIQNCKVFANCTDISGLSKSMQSRFRRLHLAAYTEEQFLDVAVRVLPKLKETTARMIGEQVWNQGNKDVRDIINIGKLLRNYDGREQMGYVLRP